MADDSIPPLASTGGLKYGVIGILLIVGTAAMWWSVREPPTPKEKEELAVVPDPGTPRSTALAETSIVLPDDPEEIEEEDADAIEVSAPPPKTRRPAQSAWNCAGELDPSQAGAVIRQNQRQVRSCYERRLKTNNLLRGRVELQLRVGSKGEVSGVRTGGTLGDSQVFSCIRSLAQTWSFPPPSGGSCAIVAAPFSFTPQH